MSYSNGRRQSIKNTPERIRQNEWNIGVTQRLEVAGQQRYREQAAQSALNAFQADLRASQDQVRMVTAGLFYQILTLQEKVKLETDAVALFTLAMKYRALVIVLFLAGIGYGVMALRSVPVDAFPDVTPVQVNIYTEAAGLTAEDIEKLFTIPVESGMAGLPNVQQVRSMSLTGLSYVSVYFTDETNNYLARQWMGEKLQEIRSLLPEGYPPPVLGANSSGPGQVY